MKVLFVCSGNKTEGIGIIVKNQGDSLIKAGIELEYYGIEGKGIIGYLKNIKKLKKKTRNIHYDIIHAHYSLSGIVASFAGSKPLVVSLMGSDTYSIFPWNLFIRFFNFFVWDSTIVKTPDMKKHLNLKRSYVVPNGVDIERFKPIEKNYAKKKVGFLKDKKYIIFLANPNRYEKNFNLARKAYDLIKDKELVLLPVYGVNNEEIPFYLNAADVLILTSLWEGSVNVVKEAMACNLPVVSTDVGDVRENTNGIDGYFIADNNPESISECLKKALSMEKNCNGRTAIISKKLDSISIAEQLLDIYYALK